MGLPVINRNGKLMERLHLIDWLRRWSGLVEWCLLILTWSSNFSSIDMAHKPFRAILYSALFTCITKALNVTLLSMTSAQASLEPPLSKSIIVNQLTQGHLFIDKLIHTKFHIYGPKQSYNLPYKKKQVAKNSTYKVEPYNLPSASNYYLAK